MVTILLFALVVIAVSMVLRSKTDPGGLVGSAVMAIVGGLLGGILVPNGWTYGGPGMNRSTLSFAIAGALTAVLIHRFLLRPRPKPKDAYDDVEPPEQP